MTAMRKWQPLAVSKGLSEYTADSQMPQNAWFINLFSESNNKLNLLVVFL